MVEALRQGLCMLLKVSQNFFETHESGTELTILSWRQGLSEISATPCQGECNAGKLKKEAKRVTLLAHNPCKSFPLGSKTSRQHRVAAQGTPRALGYRRDLPGQSRDRKCWVQHLQTEVYLHAFAQGQPLLSADPHPQPLYSSPRSPTLNQVQWQPSIPQQPHTIPTEQQQQSPQALSLAL